MLKKDPLGKGLSAILKDVEEKGTSKLIPVEEITPNPTQPRLLIKEDTLVELAASIREKGVLQPLLLRKDGKGYEIIAGERRFRAAVMAGLREVPAIIKDVDEKESAEIALIENLQREDLNPIEIASVYERFIEDFSYTQEKLAKKIGIDRATISNFVRLLKLPEWIKQLIREAKLTQGHARVLVTLKNEAEQKKFVEKILKELKVKRDRVLYVGDSEVDKGTALSSGVRFIAYKNRILEADALIEDHLALLDYLSDGQRPRV